MEITTGSQPLSPELIRQLLTVDGQQTMPGDFARLMEIYCVVKAGGVAMQIEVARRLEQTEKASLLQAIAALPKQPEQQRQVQALQQEIQELEKSVDCRVKYLQAIAPAEEAIVRDCLPLVESHFQNCEKA